MRAPKNRSSAPPPRLEARNFRLTPRFVFLVELIAPELQTNEIEVVLVVPSMSVNYWFPSLSSSVNRPTNPQHRERMQPKRLGDSLCGFALRQPAPHAAFLISGNRMKHWSPRSASANGMILCFLLSVSHLNFSITSSYSNNQ